MAGKWPEGYSPIHGVLWSDNEAMLEKTLFAHSETSDDIAEISDDVFQLRIWSDSVNSMVREELQHAENWTRENTINAPVNSMNKRGITLEAVGLSTFCAVLLRRISQLAQQKLIEFFADTLDHSHSFTVSYSTQAGEQKELNLHVDDSDVTLNICLNENGSDFAGGDILFAGLRCANCLNTPCIAAENSQVKQTAAHALLHPGAMRHAAMPLASGARTNIIIWARSSSARAAAAQNPLEKIPCPPWCGGRAVCYLQGGCSHEHHKDGPLVDLPDSDDDDVQNQPAADPLD